MKLGWILYRRLPAHFTEKDYPVVRLLEAAAAYDVTLQIYTLEQLDILNTAPLPDFILPRLGAFTPEPVQRFLADMENRGVLVCNRPSAIQQASDKWLTYQLLTQHQIPTPRSCLFQFPIELPKIFSHFPLPIILKSKVGTEGIGVCLCETATQLKDYLELLYTVGAQSKVMLQEFIETSRGREIRVLVVGQRVLGCVLHQSMTGFKANLTQGAHVFPFDTQAMSALEALVLKTTALLGLEIAGIDLLFGPEGWLVCEANSSPGFKGFEDIHGKIVAEAMLAYILQKFD